MTPNGRQPNLWQVVSTILSSLAVLGLGGAIAFSVSISREVERAKTQNEEHAKFYAAHASEDARRFEALERRVEVNRYRSPPV